VGVRKKDNKTAVVEFWEVCLGSYDHLSAIEYTLLIESFIKQQSITNLTWSAMCEVYTRPKPTC